MTERERWIAFIKGRIKVLQTLAEHCHTDAGVARREAQIDALNDLLELHERAYNLGVWE